MTAAHAPKTTSERAGWILVNVLGLGVLVFLLAPILAILPLSVNDSQFLAYPLRGLTGRWYLDLFLTDRWGLAIWNSFLIGFSATALAMILGTMAAIGLHVGAGRARAWITAFMLSPMIVPVVIYAVGLYMFLAPLGWGQTYTGLILAHATLGAPFVVVTVSAVLANFPWAIVQAAQSLGAGPATVFRRIMMPLLAPGIISGGLFAFAASFDEVVTVLLIGGPRQHTLPREMFSSLRENISPTIAAAAALMLVTSLVLLVTVETLTARTQRLVGRR